MSKRPPTTRLVKLTALVLAPVLCGVLAAGLLAGAWLALGSPSPAAGATAIEITRVGAAGATGAPGTPFFALAVGTGARSDDPALSRDDPGLADAIHPDVDLQPRIAVGEGHEGGLAVPPLADHAARDANRNGQRLELLERLLPVGGSDLAERVRPQVAARVGIDAE
jgi:hypothetical protein